MKLNNYHGIVICIGTFYARRLKCQYLIPFFQLENICKLLLSNIFHLKVSLQLLSGIYNVLK